MYLGCVSLQMLNQFLAGFEFALLEITGEHSPFHLRMQLFVQQKYDIPLTEKNWVHLISEHADSQEAALYLFYELLDEMKQSRYATMSLAELQEEHDRMITEAFREMLAADAAAEDGEA